YRPEGDDAAWRDRDPLPRFAAWLAATGVLDAAGVAAQRAAIEAEIKEAVEAEEAVPPPPLRTLIENVYSRPPQALEEQLRDLEGVRTDGEGAAEGGERSADP